jgi:hypothetical protein
MSSLFCKDECWRAKNVRGLHVHYEHKLVSVIYEITRNRITFYVLLAVYLDICV